MATTDEGTRTGLPTRSRSWSSPNPKPLRTELRQQEQRIRDRYARLSDQYQEAKGNNDIPLN